MSTLKLERAKEPSLVGFDELDWTGRRRVRVSRCYSQEALDFVGCRLALESGSQAL